MRYVAMAMAALGVAALGACADGRDHVAEGTPVYDGNRIVRWTAAGESFPAKVTPDQPYVSCGGRCVEMNR